LVHSHHTELLARVRSALVQADCRAIVRSRTGA